MPVTKHKEEFESLLEFHADALRSFYEKSNSVLKRDYLSLYEFVNVEGDFYFTNRANTRFNWKPFLKREFWEPTEQECFKNAWNLASFTPLTYVEGFAMHPGLIPLQHAWCIDSNGIVYDPTWDLLNDSPRTEYTMYKGVPFNLAYVTHVFSATKQSGSVIDNWKEKWPLLTTLEVREEAMIKPSKRRSVRERLQSE